MDGQPKELDFPGCTMVTMRRVMTAAADGHFSQKCSEALTNLLLQCMSTNPTERDLLQKCDIFGTKPACM